MQYDEFLEGEQEIKQLLFELEKTNEFLLLNLDESQHCQFLDDALAVKRDSRKKKLIRFEESLKSVVEKSAETETRLPTSIQQQTQRNESEQGESPEEIYFQSTDNVLKSRKVKPALPCNNYQKLV